MCLTYNICKLSFSNKHHLWFNWFGMFFLSLTVCTSNFGHETSLIIFLIRACILRCHYSVRAEQSPDLCNLDSKYHLHSSGGMVSSPQCVFTCTYAHTHTFKHLIVVILNQACMMDGFAMFSGPSRSTELFHPFLPISYPLLFQ